MIAKSVRVRHRGCHIFLAFCLLFGAAATPLSASADPVAGLYSYKTVMLIAGFPPGGGYDTYIRVLSRHFGKFISGNPAVVPANMPGAGSMSAANHLYTDEPNDGTVLGEFAAAAERA